MINIDNIHCGWLRLNIGGLTFNCSYLTDVLEDLNKLFNCDKDSDEQPRKICLDGEGKDLYLTAWKSYNNFIIVWEEEFDADIELLVHCFIFDCRQFHRQWSKLKEEIVKTYKREFLMDCEEGEEGEEFLIDYQEEGDEDE